MTVNVFGHNFLRFIWRRFQYLICLFMDYWNTLSVFMTVFCTYFGMITKSNWKGVDRDGSGLIEVLLGIYFERLTIPRKMFGVSVFRLRFQNTAPPPRNLTLKSEALPFEVSCSFSSLDQLNIRSNDKVIVEWTGKDTDCSGRGPIWRESVNIRAFTPVWIEYGKQSEFFELLAS